ncbi:hypothetical protein B0J13DRAFT_463350 [Dactylonectria estremocensis]|uniref:Uncharacterized protein n=1 Tax=Dactylonectria estremocensis TaxID=1079267 RepID=A0A9P9JD12_9HYPO|nr:hypothetical protein B0J13DRAFT_463350 [Dactylonectria estremocensis]
MLLKYANYNGEAPQNVLDPGATFNLTVTAPQDFWRQPPDVDIFTAPMLYQSMSLHSFLRARVTATADWTTLYEQGGLVIVLPTRTDNLEVKNKRRWIKAGIEYYDGAPHLSVVMADGWADWSMMPMPGNCPKVTLEIERSTRGSESWDGKESLWVYILDAEGNRKAVRQVTDVFENGEDGELWVGAYAGKPGETVKGETGSQLTVQFSDFNIERVA